MNPDSDIDKPEVLASYINAGLALVPIPRDAKGTNSHGWNLRENCITALDQIHRLTGNVGLAHAYCTPPTCAIDIDDLAQARTWLGERGIDLDALLGAPEAVRIDSGREGRAKLLYRLDAPLPQKKVKHDGHDMLDFRCGTENGLTVQDVLPPSIHPDTGQPYRLLGDVRVIPAIPAALLAVWRNLLGVTKAPVGTATSGELPARFVELLPGDESLARRWNGDTEGLNDASRSELDMSLTSLLVHRGFNDAEILMIHRAYPHGKVVQDGRDADGYVPEMLRKCRAERILPLDAPLVCARRMLAERCTSADGAPLWRHWNGTLYEWRGGAYRALEAADVQARVQSYLETARCRAGKKVTPFPVTPARVANVRGTLEAAIHIDSAAAVPCWLDGAAGGDPANLLVVANGVLDLTTRVLQPLNPRLFTTTALPFAYAADAGPPVAWLAFLQSLWGDDRETIETLQEFFGYCLSADSSQQKAFLVVGPMRSGKGTIARVLHALLGEDNCAGPTLAFLGTNFGLQSLIGKRLATVSDARLGSRTDKAAFTERICSLTGQDRLTIDRKYLGAWSGVLGTKLAIFTNEVPAIVDDSGALASRFIVLGMGVSFLGREDLGLANRLLAELPAILSWSLDGLERLNARGAFRQPAASRDLVQSLEDLASPISVFVRECCVVEQGATAEIGHLYGLWKIWCNKNGRHDAGTQLMFCRSLTTAVRGLERVRTNTGNRPYVYQGIRLATGTATLGDLLNFGQVGDLAAARARRESLL